MVSILPRSLKILVVIRSSTSAMDLLKLNTFLLLAFSLIIRDTLGMSDLQAEKKRLLDKLLDNYDMKIRPSGLNGTEGPVAIKINLLLRDVTSVSDYDMDFGIQVLLRQEWLDERLKYDDKGTLKYLLLTDNSKIWTPDLFFLNEKDSQMHRLMNLNTFIRIHPSGHVLYSARLSLTLWCHMNLQRFPFDSQLCSMKMASYGHTVEELKFFWKESEPLQISSNANIMGFTIGKGGTSTCHSKTLTGEYSCLRVDFTLKRDLQYYLLHIFLPSCALVILSWTVFWLDPRASVVRVLLGLGTLLAAASLASDLESTVPHVPYVKAVDLWSGVTISFLFAALLESALLSCVVQPQDESRNACGEVDMKPLARQPDVDTPKSTSEDREAPFLEGLLSRLPRDPRRLDSTARTLFPALYLAFVVLFIFIYLIL